MADSVSFRTRARTIDHLGREQIADCPTAVSELWKNAYDAYAKKVALHIYDGEVPIAAIVDDGHGMSRDEFVEKWLVVGTESKASGDETPDEDRNGLAKRDKQGQKGIGRLSSAFLGPLLLVISKRRDFPFVAAFIDWRLFENPFLYLHDIEVPVVEYERKEQLFEHLPDMFDTLMGNIWGSGKAEDEERDERIKQAWAAYDELEKEEGRSSTRKAIEKVVVEAAFEPRHMEQWPVWQDETVCGTALLIADIVFDLEAQLDGLIAPEDESLAKQAKDRLFQTLSNFTDPFADKAEIAEGYTVEDFDYSVTSWHGNLRRSVIADLHEFDLSDLEELEHVVEGTVDENGVFTGRVKAYGEWLKGDVSIRPESEVPKRSNSKAGPFHIRIGSFNQTASSSSHTPEVHQRLSEMASKYSGLMIYRNGLRVMPYGREDNDFFEIEKRRSLHFGRHFWSNRRIFGRVLITRQENPNLKDKAGREGIIDNKASKSFSDLVENILIKTAYNYFGSESDLYKTRLPEIKETRKREKAEEERKKRRASLRKRFRSSLKRLAPQLKEHLDILEEIAQAVSEISLNDEKTITEYRERLSELKDRSKDFILGEAPRKLGSLEEEYLLYRSNRRRVDELLKILDESLTDAYERVAPKEPREVAQSDLSRHAAYIHSRLRKWNNEAKSLLNDEQKRIADLTEERNKLYHERTMPLLDDVEYGRIPLNEVLTRLADEREKVDIDNHETFDPYLAALRSLQENIDLTTLADFGMDTVDEMREEIDRLHALAQLGITVEIIGHEIQSLELTMSEGLEEFPDSAKRTNAYASVKTAHESLTERLRFLSPLKLSGDSSKSRITGKHILEYVLRFFNDSLSEREINLSATDRFIRFSMHERPSRIYPVFINLINNAAYWLTRTSNGERQILLDVVDSRVVIADSGPGVDEDDLKHLFTLFFTRKVRGGRGVGLYLSKANLAAGSHKIEYSIDDKYRLLQGANFVIDFTGAQFD
ncbi:MAG: ATP-binding protein [Candidatus Thiodiazotropha endolucinida]